MEENFAGEPAPDSHHLLVGGTVFEANCLVDHVCPSEKAIPKSQDLRRENIRLRGFPEAEMVSDQRQLLTALFTMPQRPT
jgi:hypothetical protein